MMPKRTPLARAFLTEGVLSAIGATMMFIGAQSSSVVVIVGLAVFLLGGAAGVLALVKARRAKGA
jgi:hypothetical protein